MQLRPYQSDIIERTRKAIAQHGSVVLHMPTGGGKTRVAAEIVSTSEGPVWFICHRQEIERQAAAAFEAAGIDFGVVSPRGEPQYERPVQIVSVGTLARRMGDLPSPKLAIWDECHHVAAKSWAAIREQLHSTVHVGLTATPERLDGKGLKEWFSDLIVGPSTRELIDGGYLSDFRYFAPSDPDLAAAKLQAGDYRKKDASAIMNTPVLIGDAIAEYKAKANGKRALVFAASVEASIAIVDRFTAEGIAAQHIDGTTPTAERDEAVNALAAGSIKVLSNVEVFTEGFDLPAIDAVILMRPTRSLALFLQMIGRALRTADGKDEALIFDHAGLWLDHGWFDAPLPWSIEGGARKRRIASMGEGRLRRCPECKEVRLEMVETCRCGYDFPTGREIGEYDGVLREVRGVVPEGVVSRAAFEGIHRVSNRTVISWIDRGMPYTQLGVPLEDANKWVAANVDFSKIAASASAHAPPPGYANLRGFARRHGFSSEHFTKKAIGMGLPSQGGLVPILEGDDWVAANREFVDRSLASSVQKQKKHSSRVSLVEFSGMVGVKRKTLDSWAKKRGFPYDPHLGVDVQKGVDWLKSNRDKVRNLDKPSGAESMNEFARRNNRATGTIKNWIGLGLPFDGKYIPSGEGDEWVSRNAVLIWSRDRRAARARPPGHSNISDFARLVDVAKHKVRHDLVESGLPYDHKLGIPIQAALEWVRENRPDIIIPPEAWPSANDNGASKDEAAA
ncbi:DEAD/DEAH box helicase family protein [Agrobacterium sp. MS2]|uniref:DEAD/DEAH box helicase n=1 Tax=Agrobacterium sp. MS2 TaxID=1345498 RepID=UPI0011B941C2|nr:DEAD/DEAH box helicase family protein [Agrobacterium sp. MS2]